jgi:5-oxoprolinase (ATP-hydrolysing) subunit A
MDCVDLNSDMGESFGAYTIGEDEAMLEIVSTANIGCGFHGGDPLVMHKTITLAKENGVGIGAHPGFMDLWGFGRRPIMGEKPEDIEKILIYQVGAAQAMGKVLGHPIAHFKTHGSLGNMASVDPELAMACARAIKAIDADLLFLVMQGTELAKAGEKMGLRMAYEIYADRAYADDGQLVSRKLPGAMIHDPDVAVPRVVKMVEEQAVTTVSGKKIPVKIDSICVHGDNPAAVAMAGRIRQDLEKAGIAIKPMYETLR